MQKLILMCAWLGAVTFVVAAANPAHAVVTLFETFISSTGNDANNCSSPAQACAHVSRALTQTAPDGEIICYDAANYFEGPVTITQTVSIDCQHMGDMPPLVINGFGVVVTLRDLSIVDDSVAGITFTQGAGLILENVQIKENPEGILFQPSSNAQLTIKNSLFSNNNNFGIQIVPASGAAATVEIDRTLIVDNTSGIIGDGRQGGTVHATISESVVSGNSSEGVVALSAGSAVVFVADQTRVSGNNFGLVADGSATGILARNTTVFDNNTGLFATNNGTLYTYGNNSVNGNTTNGAFTGTVGLQ